MSGRNKLFLAMLVGAALLSWLSTPRDIQRPMRIKADAYGMGQPVPKWPGLHGL
jgi:hypothetical protein